MPPICLRINVPQIIGIYSVYGGGKEKGSAGAVAIRKPYLRILGIDTDSEGPGRSSTTFTPEDESELRKAPSSVHPISLSWPTTPPPPPPAYMYIFHSRITTMSRAPPTATLALIAYFDHLTPCADTGELSRQDDIYEKIVGSIAPSIFGSDDIKKAVACLLFGGSTKLLPDLVRLRGDINVLLLGDPGTAKSQMLKFAEQVRTSQLSPLCCMHFVCLFFSRPAMNTCKNACINMFLCAAPALCPHLGFGSKSNADSPTATSM